jgi:hypothetical protein
MEIFARPSEKDAFAVNLRWQVLDPFADKFFENELITQIVSDGGKLHAKYKNGADVNIGVTNVEMSAQEVKVKPYSLAAKAATSKRFQKTTTLILVKNYEALDGICYAIGLVGGNVVLDSTFLPENAESILEQFKSLCEAADRVFVVHGDVFLAQVGTDYQAFTLLELLSDKSGKKAYLEPLRNEKKVLYIVGVVIVLIFVLAASKGWDYYNAKQKEMMAQMRDFENSPGHVYQLAVKKILSEKQLIVPLTLSGLEKKLHAFPVRSGGWLLDKITCKESICTASWFSDGGTYEQFKEAADPSWHDFSYGSSEKDVLGDLKTIKMDFDLALTGAMLPAAASWPTDKEFTFDIGVLWQRFEKSGWHAGLSTIEQRGIPTTITPITVRESPDAIFGMPWQFTSQDWNMAMEVLSQYPQTTVLESFELRFNHKDHTAVIGATGLAYVKNTKK